MELVCCTTALKRHTGARRTERMRATLKCASEDAEKEGEACARKMKVDPMVGANLRKQPALVTTPGLLLLGPTSHPRSQTSTNSNADKGTGNVLALTKETAICDHISQTITCFKLTDPLVIFSVGMY